LFGPSLALCKTLNQTPADQLVKALEPSQYLTNHPAHEASARDRPALVITYLAAGLPAVIRTGRR